MGLALWIISGAVALVLARIVPLGRRAAWTGEGAAALGTALALGVVATALDFGGWREADWRSATFAALGALGAAGVFRLVTFRRDGSLQ